MLKAFGGRLRDPEKPVWVMRETEIPKGKNETLILCSCRKHMEAGFPAIPIPGVAIKTCKWSATLPGRPPVTAEMLYGQCDRCDTIYWDVASDWTRYLLLRFTAINQTATTGPKILVPGVGVVRTR